MNKLLTIILGTVFALSVSAQQVQPIQTIVPERSAGQQDVLGLTAPPMKVPLYSSISHTI